MRVAESVPEDHVGVRDRTILLGPLRQAIAAVTLVGIIARGMFLILIERRHPQVMIDESGPLAPPGILRREWHAVVARQETIRHRFADGVFDVRIDDLPRAGRFKIEARLSLLL